MLLALAYAIIAGLDRVNATPILQYNGAFQRIAGLPRFPDQTALLRFSRRLTPRHIRQLARLHYPLAKIRTAEWLPNVAFFQLLLFAFDLVHYFKRLCLPPAYRAKTLKTIRRKLLVIPGRLVKTDNRCRLKLPRDYHFQRTFESALAKVQRLGPVQIR